MICKIIISARTYMHVDLLFYIISTLDLDYFYFGGGHKNGSIFA